MDQLEELLKDRNWLEPTSSREPALWISKFCIFPDLANPEAPPIREIKLKRGLNIIWSPPAAESDDESQKGRGHAAGKSAFCRALRYLLGEKTYGNKFIEERLQGKPDLISAYLAAEVWIGETVWSVFRPISKRRKDFALKGVPMDMARLASVASKPDYKIFSDAVEEATVGKWPVHHFDKKKTAPITWLHLLESLSRDQESHLSGIHQWRSQNAASEPKETSDAQRAFLVRCVLGLADQKEPTLLAERAQHAETIKSAEQTISVYSRVFDDCVENLREVLPDLPEDIKPEDEIFVSAVKDELNRTIKTEEKDLQKRISALGLENLELRQRDAEREANILTGRIAERKEHLDSLRGKRTSYLEKSNPTEEDAEDVCTYIRQTVKLGGKTCGVPIERAMTECRLFWECGAEKLKQSAEPNPAEEQRTKILELLNDQIAALEKELREPEETIRKARATAQSYADQISIALKTKNKLNEQISLLPKKETTHIGTVESLLEALRKQHDARTLITTANGKRNDADLNLKEIRELGTEQQAYRSQIFDQIIKRLVNDELSGTLNFAPVEIRAILHRNGVLESEAYKALRCIAYDFTSLLASLNGIGHHPGFLLHDSPRESDMEPSLYRPIFELIAELESRAPESFQYIVTTTEPPPTAFHGDDFVRARLSSASEKDRLYCSNL